MARQRILLTGFGNEVFGETNPSWVAAQEACDQNMSNFATMCHELPVAYAEIVPSLETALKENRPDVIISLGVCMSRSELTIEAQAFNYVRPAQDSELTVLDPAKPATAKLLSTLPNEAIVKGAGEQGFPLYEFVQPQGKCLQQCNMTMYHALRMTANTETLAGFIHVPPLPAQANKANAEDSTRNWEGMSLSLMVGGILAAAEVTVEEISRRRTTGAVF